MNVPRRAEAASNRAIHIWPTNIVFGEGRTKCERLLPCEIRTWLLIIIRSSTSKNNRQVISDSLRLSPLACFHHAPRKHSAAQHRANRQPVRRFYRIQNQHRHQASPLSIPVEDWSFGSG